MKADRLTFGTLASRDWITAHIPESERPPVGYQVALPENSEMW
jgi:hypothetical protein